MVATPTSSGLTSQMIATHFTAIVSGMIRRAVVTITASVPSAISVAGRRTPSSVDPSRCEKIQLIQAIIGG